MHNASGYVVGDHEAGGCLSAFNIVVRKLNPNAALVFPAETPRRVFRAGVGRSGFDGIFARHADGIDVQAEKLLARPAKVIHGGLVSVLNLQVRW